MNAGESHNAAAVRRELIQLVAANGPALLDDSRRVRAMLADAVAGATAEANLIGLALSSGVPARLHDAARDPARSGTAVTETAEHLQRTSSVQRADALWAVTAIAEALGVSSAPATDRDLTGPVTPQPAAAQRPSPVQPGPNDVLVQVGGQEHVAAPGSVVTIGRDPSSTIALESSAVSRHHGRVQLGASGWEYVDLDSTQGSFVNGVRVRTHALQGETSVTLGQGADAVRMRLAPVGRANTVLPPAAPGAGQARATEVPLRPGGALGSLPSARTEVGGAGAPALTVTLGGTTRTVPANTSLTIGRETDNGLVATGSTVSRHHLRIEGTDAGWRLRDLGSTSGTWADGGRVTDVALVGRQEFVVGDPKDGDRLVTQAPGTAAGTAGSTAAGDRRKRTLVPAMAAAAVVAVIGLVAGGYLVWQKVNDDDAPAAAAKLSADELATQLAKGTVLLKWSDPKFVNSGSGTVIDKEKGLILTNAHVAAPAAVGSAIRDGYVLYSPAVKNPAEIEVFVSDGVGKPAQPRFTAKVVAVDGYLDLAVLKIDKTTVGAFPEPEDLAELTEIPVGDSDSLDPTDEMTIIGYPSAQESLGPTYGTAVVSGWTGDDRIGSNKAYINSTDAVAHGNSGGLAADGDGKLVGVPSRLRADNLAAPGSQPDYTTVGAAIRPVNLAVPLIEAAMKGKAYTSPYAVAAPNSAKIVGVLSDFVEPGDPGTISNSGKCFGDTEEYPNYALGVRYAGFSGGKHTDVLAIFTDPETGDVLDYSVTPWQTAMPKQGCMTITTGFTTLPDHVALRIAVGGDVVQIWQGTLW